MRNLILYFFALGVHVLGMGVTAGYLNRSLKSKEPVPYPKDNKWTDEPETVFAVLGWEFYLLLVVTKLYKVYLVYSVPMWLGTKLWVRIHRAELIEQELKRSDGEVHANSDRAAWRYP